MKRYSMVFGSSILFKVFSFLIISLSALILFLAALTPVLKFIVNSGIFAPVVTELFMRPFLRIHDYLYSNEMYYSTIAALLNLCLTLLTLGIIGALLFMFVTPGLNLIFSENIPLSFSGIDYAFKKSMLHGDSLWPTTILISALFSAGFLIAGSVTNLAGFNGTIGIAGSLVYLLCLWLWALLLWSLVCAEWLLKST